MKLKVKEKKILKEYLYDLDPQIAERGYFLFASGQCKCYNKAPENKSYQFTVEGNIEPYYEVSINFPKDQNDLWEWEDDFFDRGPYGCECIYYEENLQCKHVAAAIYYLLENGNSKKSTISKSTGKKSKIDLPLTIECNPASPEDFLNKLGKHAKGLTYSLLLESVELEENTLIYFLADYGHQYGLSIEALEDKVIIDCNYVQPHLVNSALKWLYERISEYPNDLVFIQERGRKALMMDFLKKYGLEEIPGKIEDLFAVDFDGKEFLMVPKGKLEGLLDETMITEVFQDLLISPLEKWKSGEQLLQTEKTPQANFNAAIALETNYSKNSLHHIHLIKGKGTKNNPHGLKTKLDWLKDPEDQSLSNRNGLSSLFTMVSSINHQFTNLAKSDENYLELFDKVLNFIKSRGQLSVYLINNNHYNYNYKPRPTDLRKLDILPSDLFFEVSKDETLKTLMLHPVISIDGNPTKFQTLQNKLNLVDFFAIWEGDKILLFQSPKEIKALASFWASPVIRFTDKNKKVIEKRIIEPLSKDFPIEFKDNIMEIADLEKKPKKKLFISEMGNFVILRPQVNYGENLIANPLENGTLLDYEAKKTYSRERELEVEFLSTLKELHPFFNKQGNQGFFHLTFEEFIDNYWFINALETMKKKGIQVFGLDELKNFKFSPHPAKVDFKLETKPDWFEAKVEIAFGDNKVKLKDLKKAIDAGNNFIELTDGSLGIIPEEWMKKFGKLFRSSHQDKDTMRMAKAHFGLVDEIADPELHQNILKEIAEKKEKLASFKKIEHSKPPKQLKATLRNYQQEGLNWLNFLVEYGWGGILADDMGLGKTLQLIALISQLKEKNKKSGNVLVIAPTTLLFNWKNELEKFAPDIDYFIHHGQRYDDPKEFKKHDLILTSYGVVINDIDLLKKIKFNLIVADESQAIKNVASRRHKAVTQLKSPLKIALSGTPIENNIGELFAQMNFTNPGFFSTLSAFKRDYANKLKKDDSKALTTELRKKVAPFILRRTKEEVLTELPDKTEEILYCEMGKTQRKLYDAYRNEYRDYLLKKFEDDGEDQSKMFVLEGLTKLRQLCDATALVKNGEAVQESAKIDLLLEHILEKTGKHKILVFSQFVKMLEIIKGKLDEEQVPYVYLDGKTTLKEREKRVNHFQEDEDTRVFLISLKAGGTGLNLTSADYVYIVDPWWNPATENQAIDRCYRMGQKKNVFAYRIVCRNSVEEKILQLQEAKKKLSHDIIGEGESILRELNKEALLDLFN